MLLDHSNFPLGHISLYLDLRHLADTPLHLSNLWSNSGCSLVGFEIMTFQEVV